MKTTTVTSFTDTFLKGSEALIASSPAFLRALQQIGLDTFVANGFPTTKNEEWKYTNLAPVLKQSFDLYPTDNILTAATVDQLSLLKENSILLVFENGKLNKSLSRISELPKGLIVGDLADHLDHPAVQSHLGHYADGKTESLVALNTAFIRHGTFLQVEKNVVVEEPVYILSVTTATQALTYPRNLFIAESGSKIKIVESVHGTTASFTNAVTEIVIRENAFLELTKIQAEEGEASRVDHTEASLHKNSLFHIHTISGGSKLVRNDLHIVLNAENANAYLNGLYVINGNDHVDNHTLVDHAMPNCYTNELYKGIMGGRSHGVFNGKIMVRKDAQKTNAYQSNKNIILSDEAMMNTKPQLEIYADDVKCSHGATTGRLDDESLFYLRSRGIGLEAARALLTIAFADDVLSRISIESLKEELQSLIHRSLNERN